MSSRYPVLTAKKLLRALQRVGFYVHEQEGSHVQLRHRTDPAKRITVPRHDGEDLHRGVLKAILDQAGLSPEELKRLL